jgi:Ca2+-binding RTX toxin-like protein
MKKALTLSVSTAVLGAALLLPAASTGTHLQTGACANPTIVAHNQGDTVRGTDGPDVIRGGNGPDTIYGLRGDDRICGGTSADTIYGNRGDDSLQGNHAPDQLFGNRGHDHANGGGSGDDPDVCRAEEEVSCEG